MFESHGWWFPDYEAHLPKMLWKSVTQGGPAEYQQKVRHRSLGYTARRNLAIDIGANVGLWSRELCENFAQVIAFEPVPDFRECLAKNVPAENLTLSPLALGAECTTVDMIITEGNAGHTHVDPESLGHGVVNMLTLDQFVEEYKIPTIDYIKIDCEGYELRVLEGAEQTVKRDFPIVVIEQKPHPAYSKEYGQLAAIELLQSWGMRRVDQVKDDWIMGWG